MSWFLAAIAIWLLGGVAALGSAFVIGARAATFAGSATASLGCLIGLFGAGVLWISGQPVVEWDWSGWSMPFGSIRLAWDPLSGVFALPILVLGGLAAVYGGAYFGGDHAHGRRRQGVSWFFYNLLLASMLAVVLARNAVLFLLCWELMSLSGFFLVLFQDEEPEVRDAARVYLIATHVGALALLAFFALVGHGAERLDFVELGRHFDPALAGLAFVLAVVGFGAKAGFVPLHVWLPEAHPVAPSHVSAVLSGVVVKTGIYGLVRALTFLPTPQPWWGWLLIVLGAASGIWGILCALAQHDLKKLLAYSTVENVGVIALGLGVGVLGLALSTPVVAALGFTGSLLHVINHSLFKGALFLGAGVVARQTGTRELDRLGGLARRMPITAGAFVLASVAIVGLPPLNGFLGEFLIYIGAFGEEIALGPSGGLPAVGVIGSLALIGGLAAIAFTKAFGIAFLGEPRTPDAREATEAGPGLTTPIVVLVGLCVAIGLGGPFVIKWVLSATSLLVDPRGIASLALAGRALDPLRAILAISAVLLGLIALLTLARWLMLRGREVGQAGTWDCGYARPTERMAYTGSSFVQPVTAFFGGILGLRSRVEPPRGLFPATGQAKLSTSTINVLLDRVYQPLFRWVARGLIRLHWIQQGSVHTYVLYIALTIGTLLAWFVMIELPRTGGGIAP